MAVDSTSIRWKLTAEASRFFKRVRGKHGDEWYLEQIDDLKALLNSYFETSERCDQKLGRTISPLGATENGGKRLKVRWAIPGRGKSGGLRLLVAAYCGEREVVVLDAAYRVDEPSF